MDGLGTTWMQVYLLSGNEGHWLRQQGTEPSIRVLLFFSCLPAPLPLLHLLHFLDHSVVTHTKFLGCPSDFATSFQSFREKTPKTLPFLFIHAIISSISYTDYRLS